MRSCEIGGYPSPPCVPRFLSVRREYKRNYVVLGSVKIVEGMFSKAKRIGRVVTLISRVVYLWCQIHFLPYIWLPIARVAYPVVGLLSGVMKMRITVSRHRGYTRIEGNASMP